MGVWGGYEQGGAPPPPIPPEFPRGEPGVSRGCLWGGEQGVPGGDTGVGVSGDPWGGEPGCPRCPCGGLGRDTGCPGGGPGVTQVSLGDTAGVTGGVPGGDRRGTAGVPGEPAPHLGTQLGELRSTSQVAYRFICTGRPGPPVPVGTGGVAAALVVRGGTTPVPGVGGGGPAGAGGS